MQAEKGEGLRLMGLREDVMWRFYQSEEKMTEYLIMSVSAKAWQMCCPLY